MENNRLVITVLGEAVDKDNFPKLYQWANNNRETLEDQLKSLANSWHNGSIAAAMLALESDLEHG